MGTGMVLLAVGLVLIVFAPLIGVGFWRRWRHWPSAVATVTKVKVETRRASSGASTNHYWATYRFTDAAGEVHSGKEYMFRRPKKGDEFRLRYDPEQPENSNASSGDRPLLIVLLGALPAAGAALIVWGFLLLYGG